MSYLQHASFSISVLGVLVIVFGVLCGLLRFLRSELAAMRGGSVESARRKLRQVLGYYLLLGLKFLIAADIIKTLIKPTTQDLILLGAIVAIRTVISYSLNSELAHESCLHETGEHGMTGRPPHPGPLPLGRGEGGAVGSSETSERQLASGSISLSPRRTRGEGLGEGISRIARDVRFQLGRLRRGLRLGRDSREACSHRLPFRRARCRFQIRRESLRNLECVPAPERPAR